MEVEGAAVAEEVEEARRMSLRSMYRHLLCTLHQRKVRFPEPQAHSDRHQSAVEAACRMSLRSMYRR